METYTIQSYRKFERISIRRVLEAEDLEWASEPQAPPDGDKSVSWALMGQGAQGRGHLAGR